MECCLIHLMLRYQQVSVELRVCHRESVGRRPETASREWSAIFAIGRWPVKRLPIAGCRTLRGVTLNQRRADDYTEFRQRCVARYFIHPRQTRTLFLVMRTKNCSQKHFQLNFQSLECSTPHVYQIGFNIIQLCLTFQSRNYFFNFSTPCI